MNFFIRYKKIFLIIGFLGLIFVLGYLLWHIFFATPTTKIVKTNNSQGTISGLPIAGPNNGSGKALNGNGNLPAVKNIGGLSQTTKSGSLALGGVTKTKALTNSSTLNPTLSSGGGVQYYNTQDGHFYHINNNGQKVLLSSKTFYDVQKIVWSPNKNKAVLIYPDGRKTVYNFQTQKQVTLPFYWHNFSFSPTGNKLVSKSLGLDSENHWLITSNADGSQAKAIVNIGTNDKTVYPSWSPNRQIIAMYTKGVDFNRQEVYFVGLNNENFKSTMIEGRGFESQWSTKGDRLLYSVYNTNSNLNPRLWVVDAEGNNISKNRQDLGLATWSSKCTFSSDNTVYCAVPESLPRGAGLFPQLANQIKDNLYKVNLSTGAKQLIAIPQGNFNISQVMVSAKNHKLYFTDRSTKQIYQINLP